MAEIFNRSVEAARPVIERARKVGERAVANWLDIFSPRYHLNRLTEASEMDKINEDILEATVRKHIFEHDGDSVAARQQSETLCIIFGNVIYKAHNSGDIHKIAWAAENYASLCSEIDHTELINYFKPEQVSIIQAYLDPAIMMRDQE